MTSNYQTMCEPARTFEDCGIRWSEDEPFAIPCLQTALNISREMNVSPHTFRALIYFFSSLLPHEPMYYRRNESRVLPSWWDCIRDIGKVRHHTYQGIQTHNEVSQLLNQLHPVATCLELEMIASTHLRGHPRIGISPIDGFSIIDRGHDWIVRCAYECDIPDTYKSWLQLMYEGQPHATADDPSRSRNGNESTLIACLQTAADEMGLHAGIIPLTKFWLRQVLTIIDAWAWSLQVDGDRQEVMPPYRLCVTMYHEMWNQFQKDSQNPFSVYSYEIRVLLRRSATCGSSKGVGNWYILRLGI